ncbi:MAG: DegT/DnrJ/EryC1/StrS family aminotransferase, partial [Desulfomonilaceae bacterium]|nr:DegT/DnrJ/EryC1/StrS family aminotransferase [Desulfomonilaceae bacterium]
IESAITPRTRVIVPVHYGGVACAMNEILEFAETHGLTVVEDAAHGILASYKGRFLGTLGNIGVLSFHETKNIVSGRGGALLLNDEGLVERAAIALENGTDRLSFLQGRVEEYSWQDVGSAFGMSEITASLLFAQLEAAALITEKRRRLFFRYREQLEPLAARGVVRVPYVPDGVVCNGHIFFVITRDREQRTRLIEYLRGNGVTAASHYVPLHLSKAGRRFGRVSGRLQVTEEIVPGLVRLPLYPDMEEQDVDKVIDLMTAFYATSV